jgi:DNA-binding transcriptional ArsR family regulator
MKTIQALANQSKLAKASLAKASVAEFKRHKILGSKTRWAIYNLLLGSPLTVTELSRLSGSDHLSRISHQLKLMREAGIVSAKDVGSSVVYSVK